MSRSIDGSIIMSAPARFPELSSGNPTPKDAARYIQSLVRFLGPGFHPDEQFADYIRVDSGAPSLTLGECEQLERDLARARDSLEAAGKDVYAISLRAARRLLHWGSRR